MAIQNTAAIRVSQTRSLAQDVDSSRQTGVRVWPLESDLYDTDHVLEVVGGPCAALLCEIVSQSAGAYTSTDGARRHAAMGHYIL